VNPLQASIFPANQMRVFLTQSKQTFHNAKDRREGQARRTGAKDRREGLDIRELDRHVSEVGSRSKKILPDRAFSLSKISIQLFHYRSQKFGLVCESRI
jgi:hypothetical protein